MDEIVIHIETDVNPTETEDKVRRAVENLFGCIPIQTKPLHKGSLLFAEAKGQESLTKFHNLLNRERVRAAARIVFLQGLERRAFSFCLNKQVAFVGHVSFSQETGESPLGPIKVRIECPNPKQIIDWFTSRI